jgi:membrane-bound ClpP family serine protease
VAAREAQPVKKQAHGRPAHGARRSERFLKPSPTRSSTVPPSALTRTSEHRMHPYARIGILLLVAWGVLWLGFKIVSGIVHLLLVVGAVLLVYGLVRKGARAVGRRL